MFGIAGRCFIFQNGALIFNPRERAMNRPTCATARRAVLCLAHAALLRGCGELHLCRWAVA